MTRQILVSTPPAAPSAGRDSAEFGQWLTHELRAKGAPKEAAPSAPIVLPSPDAGDEKQAEFARWLTSDLRVRGSCAPPPDSLAPPPDSLAPQLLPAEAEGASTGALPLDLEDEDFSVLPGRRKSGARSGRHVRLRSAAALGAVLLAFGFFLMRSGGESVADAAGSAAAAEGMTAVLPPPPPDSLPPEPDALPAEVEANPGSPRAVDEAPVDPEDPRFRLSGPSVGRLPDLPSPVLSRLAREEMEQARERYAAARKSARPTEPVNPIEP